MFFFLAQTEQGDIFKITLETDEDMVSAETRFVLNFESTLLVYVCCLNEKMVVTE